MLVHPQTPQQRKKKSLKICRLLMYVFFNFNSSWYLLLFAFVAAWALLFTVRRKWHGWHPREVKEQVLLGFGGMASLALMEFFAVSMGLWHYATGDWPIILWPTYFAAILFGYQLLRAIERVLLRRPLV
jgi:hypothetical protein